MGKKNNSLVFGGMFIVEIWCRLSERCVEGASARCGGTVETGRGRLGAHESSEVVFLTVLKWVALPVVVLATAFFPGVGRADNCRQWGLTRDPCNVCLMARYFKMIEARPNDPFPMGKLRRCRSLTSLIRRYEARVRARPRWYSGYVILGHLYLAGGKNDKAVAAYRKASGIAPTRWDAYWSLGNAYKKLKKWGDARRVFEKALSLVKSKRLQKKVLRALIGVAIAGRDMGGARTAFDRLVRLEPHNKSLRTEFARLLVEHGRYQRALAEYRVLLAQVHADNRRKAELLRDMGEVYERMGRDTDAVRTYRKAMRLTTRGHWLRAELTQKIVAIYRRKNDLPSLAAYYERTWRSRGFFEWKVLAGVYDEMGRIDDAINAYRRALRIRPSALDARDRLILLLFRAGRKQEALKALKKQVRLAPGEPRYLLRLAKMYWRRHRIKQALALLARGGRLFPTDPSVHSVLADLYSRWGRPELAFREYQKLVRIDPAEPSHLVDLGEQYWQRGQTKKARATWRRLLAPGLYRNKQEAYEALAQVYADHGLLGQAIRYFRKAIALNPKNAGLYRALARTLAASGKYDQALAAWWQVLGLSKGESRKPWRAEARREIIRLWKRMGVLRGKLRLYMKRFSEKKSVEDGFFLAEAFLAMGRMGGARRVLETLVSAHPSDVEVRLMLADLYVRLGRPLDAIAQYRKLVVLFPAKAKDFYTRIAELYLLAYQDDQALAYAKKALKMSKGDAEGWARVGAIYAKKGDDGKAIEAFERALAIRPRFFRVAFTLAGLFVRTAKYRRAAAIYHDIVARSPSESMVARAGKQALDIDEYLGTFEDLERRLISLSFVYTHKLIYRRLLMELYSRWIPALVRLKRFSPVRAERERARKRLHAIGMRALKPLLEALASKDGPRREMALRLLGHMGNKEAALPLVRLAMDPPDDIGEGPQRISFQLRALVAAARLADGRTVTELGKLLRSRRTEIREVAAWGLALIGGPRAYPFLLAALDDMKMGVEIAACLGLGAYGDKVVPRLAVLVRDSGRRPEVRAACAWGLGRTQSEQALKVLIEHAVPEGSLVSLAATWALGMLAMPGTVGFLAKTLWSRKGPGFDAALWALARSAAGLRDSLNLGRLLADIDLDASGQLSLADFVRRLKPRDVRISLKGRRALVGPFRTQLIEGMIHALSSYPEVAARVLDQLDSNSRRFSLGRLDPAPRKPVMPAGVAAVAKAVMPRLRLLSASALPDMRSVAVSVLIKALPSDVLAVFRSALRTADSSVKSGAVRAAPALVALDKGQRSKAIALLIRSYEQMDTKDRCGALRSLTLFGGARAEDMLVRAARSDNGFEATCALEASMQGKMFLLVARVLSRSDVASLRLAALLAVSRRGYCPSWFDSLASDPASSVRKALSRVLRSCPNKQTGRNHR